MNINLKIEQLIKQNKTYFKELKNFVAGIKPTTKFF